MKVEVPDIGDFDEVPVIEILVSEGDTVSEEDPLVTLESDKATMDVPSPAAGTVKEILVSVGDKVSQGTAILELEAEEGGDAEGDEDGGEDEEAEPDVDASEQAEDKRDDEDGDEGDEDGDEQPKKKKKKGASGKSEKAPDADRDAQVVVIGSGPGGYSAAFRAADLGLDVVLVERFESLGGVCLNVGCIPSKALLHAARVIADAEDAAAIGIRFGEPRVDLDALREATARVVGTLNSGLAKMARARGVRVVRGTGRFASPEAMSVDGPDGAAEVRFAHAIIAAGSEPVRLPGLPDDPRIMDSTGALALEEIPGELLVVGGGIIGMEMATVYDALGARVTVVEMLDQLIPGCDPDLVKPLRARVRRRYAAIHLGARVDAVEAADDGLHVRFAGDDAPEPARFDRVLVAVGRRANGDRIGADAAGVEVDDRGVIAVDERLRTNVPHIHAIGDITGDPMLAHRATHQGKVAAEVIAGRDVAFDARSIPSVAYTDPEIAWTGLTEGEAAARDIEVEVAAVPWGASGRALTMGRPEGRTKLVLEPGSRRILGAGIVGAGAGELIAEAVHAIEMGADAEDLALGIHPHPTLSETLGLAAEAAEGTVTDLYLGGRGR